LHSCLNKVSACLPIGYWKLANFAQNKAEAIERYKQFIDQGKGKPSLTLVFTAQANLFGGPAIHRQHATFN
jgi:hypothetical protein